MEAYPLQWPLGWKRTKNPVRSRFGKYYDKPSIEKARQFVQQELKRMGATHPIISTNQALRLDGMPYSNRREPDDKGVAVYFTYQGDQRVIACDSYVDMGSNLYAIGLTIEAMRGIDRWGCSEILARAFQGFKALPETASASSQAWWTVLGVSHDCSFAEIRRKYHELAKTHHPDAGGDHHKWLQIQSAYEKATAGIP